MIFRTGSVLIVGKCSEEVLYNIYDFLCNIFTKNKDDIKAYDINHPISDDIGEIKREQSRKIRKKTIYVNA
jgi:hypothetical protein